MLPGGQSRWARGCSRGIAQIPQRTGQGLGRSHSEISQGMMKEFTENINNGKLTGGLQITTNSGSKVIPFKTFSYIYNNPDTRDEYINKKGVPYYNKIVVDYGVSKEELNKFVAGEIMNEKKGNFYKDLALNE